MEKTTIHIPVKIVDKPQKTVAGEKIIPQPDILYLDSVLVSTGENKNDDVFLPEEIWKARKSPKYKPVDWAHETGSEVSDEEFSKNPNKPISGNQIIGVMYDTLTVDENNLTISEEKISASDFKLPSKFHIIDKSMIWKSLFPTVASRIEKGAKEGTLFVSMEAWFKGFDYQVGAKIVARNEETVFLDKQLRANGGTGIFGSVPVKRILRDITFGGKGIVYRPANEASIITSVTHNPMSAQASEVYNQKAIASNIIGEINSDGSNIKESIKMADSNQNTPAPVVAGISVDEYKAMVTKATQLEQSVKTKDEELSVAKTKLEVAEKKLTEAVAAEKAKADEISKKLAEAEQKLATMAKEKLVAGRRSKIATELKVEGERLEKLLSVAKDMSDETFASWVSATKDVLSQVASQDQKKKEDEAKAAAEKLEADKKAKEEADKKAAASEGVTDPKILDGIKAPAAPAAGVDNNNAPADLKTAFATLASAVITKRSQ